MNAKSVVALFVRRFLWASAGALIVLLLLFVEGTGVARAQGGAEGGIIAPTVGIGIELDFVIMEDDFIALEVVDTLCGGPAQKAGIKIDDKIIAINGEITHLKATDSNIAKVDELLALLKEKPAGTPFKIKLRRRGAPAGFTETTVFSELLFYENGDC